MGYTHYWRFKPAQLRDWASKIADCDKIIAASKERLELDLEGSDEMRIWVNGPDDSRDLNHETMDLPRTLSAMEALMARNRAQWRHDESMHGFDFCKTARKPYDEVIVACLCVMAEAGLDVSSDGSPNEWEDGRALAEAILGRPIQLPPGVLCDE